MIDPVNINASLLRATRDNDYAGYDPFDALNSRWFRRTPFFRSDVCRLAWLQLAKRSPLNLRQLMGVPKMRNPKGIALFILGFVEDFERTNDLSYIDEAVKLGDWLLEQRCSDPDWSAHACWGYHFDWQARAFYVPRGKPNVITTIYVARALVALSRVTNDTRYREAGLDAGRFISARLGARTAEGLPYYAYIPGEATFVHNANLWASAWCAVVGKEHGDEKLSQQAFDAAMTSVNHQLPDGSWRYGLNSHHGFIDGFHTGYNLEALCMLRDALGTRAFDDSIQRGYAFYVTHLFESDGTPKYYDRSVYPMDTHTFAQAVITLLKVGGRLQDIERSEAVVRRAIELLYLPAKKRFAYQRSRWVRNVTDYTRWTQAWAYFALAMFNRARASESYREAN